MILSFSSQDDPGRSYHKRRGLFWVSLLAVLLATGGSSAASTEEKDKRFRNLRRRRNVRHSSYARDSQKDASHNHNAVVDYGGDNSSSSSSSSSHARVLRWVNSNRGRPAQTTSAKTFRNGDRTNTGDGSGERSGRGGLANNENMPQRRDFDEEEDSEDRFFSNEDRYYVSTVEQPIRRHWTDGSSGSQSADRSGNGGMRDRKKKRKNMMGGGNGGGSNSNSDSNGGGGDNSGGGGGDGKSSRNSGMRMRMRMGMSSSNSYPHPPPTPGFGYVTRRPTLRPTFRPIGTLFPTFVDEIRPPTPLPTLMPTTTPVNIVRATMELVFVTPARRRLAVDETTLKGEVLGLTDDEYALLNEEYASLVAREYPSGRDFIPGEDRDLTEEEYILLAEQLSKYYTDFFAADISFELVGTVGIQILEETKMYFPGGYV